MATIDFHNTNGKIKRFSCSSFAIYEGDWGRLNGARFEVWMQYDNSLWGKKLFEKN